MGVFAFAYLAVYHPLCLVFCSAWRGLPAQQSHGVATGSWRRQVGVSSSGAAFPLRARVQGNRGSGYKARGGSVRHI